MPLEYVLPDFDAVNESVTQVVNSIRLSSHSRIDGKSDKVISNDNVILGVGVGARVGEGAEVSVAVGFGVGVTSCTTFLS